ncbi:hypothetical protein [Sinorhizobium meliloti]|nr:hypothetical protein [Sinorhizobium meliloti]
MKKTIIVSLQRLQIFFFGLNQSSEMSQEAGSWPSASLEILR